jgi:hypothetical protein
MPAVASWAHLKASLRRQLVWHLLLHNLRSVIIYQVPCIVHTHEASSSKDVGIYYISLDISVELAFCNDGAHGGSFDSFELPSDEETLWQIVTHGLEVDALVEFPGVILSKGPVGICLPSLFDFVLIPWTCVGELPVVELYNGQVFCIVF